MLGIRSPIKAGKKIKWNDRTAKKGRKLQGKRVISFRDE
jgi:hypothetical protein